MPISQLNSGRVSTSLMSLRMAEALSHGQSGIARLQTQLATGKKFLLPSEAPTAATQTLTLQKLDERRAAFQQSIQTNQGFLATADQAIGTINDALVQARGLAQAAAGDQVTSAERAGLVLELEGLIRSVITAGNTQYAGRYLFAGTATSVAPFESTASGTVRYRGNGQSISGFADFNLLIPSGVDGAIGLGAVTSPESRDLNPALTLDTRLDQLHAGAGIDPGTIRVTLDDGINVIRRDLDLRSAETIQDLKTQIENTFAAEAITVTVDIDPLSPNGLRVTPSAGTIRIQDREGGTTARGLGIATDPVAVVQGADLDPQLSLFTPIATLNANTGIGATLGTGLQLVHGNNVITVDLDGATTVQDVLNRIREADPNVLADISADGKGLTVSSRLNGVNFSIGENGGTNATALGIRTLTADVRLDDLNLGTGIPRDASIPLTIVRRDGSSVDVDLRNAITIQDVVNAINAVDPGVLTASLSTYGNGISLTDSSGSGPLTVESNNLGEALGLAGSDNSGPAGVLVGTDPHPRQPPGVLNLLITLKQAVADNDVGTIGRIATELDAEAARIAVVRGDLGIRQQQLDSIDNQLADRHIDIQSQLERLIEVDLAETITAFTAQQQALEAYLSVASRTLQLSLLQYL